MGFIKKCIVPFLKVLLYIIPNTYIAFNYAELIGYDMAVKAANEAYQQAGLTAEDVSIVELHDCFSTNELIMYEALVSVCVCVCIFLKFA